MVSATPVVMKGSFLTPTATKGSFITPTVTKGAFITAREIAGNLCQVGQQVVQALPLGAEVGQVVVVRGDQDRYAFLDDDPVAAQ